MRVARIVAVVAVFVVTSGFRFLAIQSFSNDHFVHLTGAQQILFGDWPVRDFVDTGKPLMFALSAAAQVMLGRTLFADAVLVSIMFGLSAALTVAAVRHLTGSLAAGLLAALFEVAIFPRTYGYEKLIALALCFYMFGRYVTRPDRGRLIAIGVAMATVSLLRHDNAVYLCIGGLLTVLLWPWPTRREEAIRRGVLLTVTTALVMVPYFLYIQRVEGLVTYFRDGLEFSYIESQGQPHRWPNPFVDRVPEAALLYVFNLIPLIALGCVFAGRKRPDARETIARVVPVAVSAMLANMGLIRAPLAARVPDAVVPAVVLGAWLVTYTWRSSRRVLLVPVSVAAALVVGVWIAQLGHIVARVESVGVVGQWGRTRERFAERSAELEARFAPHQFPTHAVEALVPFFEYLDRCTTTSQRLFLAGYIPEVGYYAQRPFAGGAYIPDNYATPALQQRVIDRLLHQDVPFALVPSDYAADLRLNAPIVSGFLNARYSPMADVVADANLTVRILLNKAYAVAPVDPASGWPCVSRLGTTPTASARKM